MKIDSLLAITCWKSPTETREMWNTSKVNNKDTRITPMTAVYVFMSSDIALITLLLVFTVTLLSTKNEKKLKKFLCY